MWLSKVINQLLFHNGPVLQLQAAALAQSVGEEISQMLTEQNKLEQQFALLVAEQPSLRNLPNKNKLIENQQQVLAVTEKLRLGTQALCRNLKVPALTPSASTLILMHNIAILQVNSLGSHAHSMAQFEAQLFMSLNASHAHLCDFNANLGQPRRGREHGQDSSTAPVPAAALSPMHS